jgi:hypothetical protein
VNCCNLSKGKYTWCCNICFSFSAGKACSHVATVAYKAEALRRLREDGSCTSNLCAWNDMSKKRYLLNSVLFYPRSLFIITDDFLYEWSYQFTKYTIFKIGRAIISSAIYIQFNSLLKITTCNNNTLVFSITNHMKIYKTTFKSYMQYIIIQLYTYFKKCFLFLMRP